MNNALTLSVLLVWAALNSAIAAGPAGNTPIPAPLYPPSYQVNVDAQGQNIAGDAANEPSLCVDPTHPDHMAIGWRQFDTVTNDFRQAGWAYSTDAGVTWSPNQPISPCFDQTLGYPAQEKIGDYISMVSLNDGGCIAYTATFNGEEDVYFVRVPPPILATVTSAGGTVTVAWNAVVGQAYAVQYKGGFDQPWSPLIGAGSLVATASLMRVADPAAAGTQRFYRVIQLP